MIDVLLAASAGLTTLVAYKFATKRLLLKRRDIATAILFVTETIGLSVAFLVLNSGFAALLVVIGQIAGFPMSLHAASDEFFLFCSVIQGLVFQFWQQLSLRPADD